MSGQMVPKGYKQTEVGVIPEDWKCLELEKLVNSSSPITYGVLKPGEYFPNGIPLLQIVDVIHGRVKIDSLHRISTDLDRQYSRTKLYGNEIVVSLVGTIGKVAYIPKALSGSNLHRNLARISISDFNHSKYVFYCLKSNILQKRIKLSTFGTTQALLNLSDLRALPVPLPPTIEEQKLIARALSDIDALIEGLEGTIGKKRHIKQGASQELLTGKKRLPGFSCQWEEKPIGEFADCLAGGTPSTLEPRYWGGDVCWMSSGELHLKKVFDVVGRITYDGLENSSTQMLPSNCILIGLAGQGKTRGTVAMNMIPLCTNQSIAAILPNESFVSDFLYHNLDTRYTELRELSTGDGGRGGLNLAIIRSIKVPFFEREEQQAIATILSDMDTEIATLEAKLAKTRQLKQGMMHELLIGRIRLI
jgi:type I restriction enzyme, S subunit